MGTNAYKSTISGVHDAPPLMAIPLGILALGSIFVGYLGKEMMIGSGSDFWGGAIFTAPWHAVQLEAEYITQAEKMRPLFFIGAGALCAALLVFNDKGRRMAYNIKMHPWGLRAYLLFNQRWFFDIVYNSIGRSAMKFAYAVTFKALDKGSFEMIGPFGISQTFTQLSHQMSKLQSGFIYHYAVVMLCGLLALITGVVLWDFLDLFIDARLFFLFFTSFAFLHLAQTNE